MSPDTMAPSSARILRILWFAKKATPFFKVAIYDCFCTCTFPVRGCWDFRIFGKRFVASGDLERGNLSLIVINSDLGV